jgi:thiol-disulfide isomerase/thioredoxin
VSSIASDPNTAHHSLPLRGPIQPSELRSALKTESETDVVFFAHWCPHCRAFLAELAVTPRDRAFLLVDISDTGDPAWDMYDVRVIPTVVRFERGAESARIEARRGEGLAVADLLLLSNDEPVGEDLQRFEAPGG